MGLNQEFDQQRDRLGQHAARAGAQRHACRRRSSWRSITCCTTCGCSRAAREVGLMRRSGEIAAGAHVRGDALLPPGRMEYEVMAELLHEFNRHGADISYHPIVGGGANSCVLHYRDNNARLERRRPAAGGCGLRVRLLRLRHHPHLSGQRPLHAASSARSTRWCWRRSAPRSPRSSPAITGMSRTTPRCAPSPRA